MAKRGQQQPRDLQSAQRITPVATPRGNTPLASLPRATLTAAQQLAPLSQTLAGIAGHVRKQDEEKNLGLGSAAFDKVEADALKALQKNQTEWRKAVQAGAAELSNPHQLKSYWRDAGAQMAAHAQRQAQDQWSDLTSVLGEDGMLRADRSTPDHFALAAQEAVSAAFEFDGEGLPQEAQQAFVRYRQRFEMDFVPKVTAAGIEAATKHNDELKSSRNRQAFDTVFEAGSYTEEAAIGLVEQVEEDFRQGFTSAESPGKARHLFASAGIDALQQFMEADQPEEGLAALDFLRSLAPGGAPLGEDPKYTGMFEDLEDRFQAAESNVLARENKRHNDGVRNATDEAFETLGPRVRAAGTPYERSQELEKIERELTEDQPYGELNEAVIEQLRARLTPLTRDITQHDDMMGRELMKEIHLGSPEELELMSEKLRGALAENRISNEVYSNLTNTLKEKLSLDPVRGSASAKRLAQELRLSVNMEHLDPSLAKEFQDEALVIYDEAARRLEDLDDQADQAPDRERFLQDQMREFLPAYKERMAALDEKATQHQEFMVDVQAGWARGLDQTPAIEQALQDGSISLSRYTDLRNQNSKEADMESNFFYPGGPADIAIKGTIDTLLSSDNAEGVLIELGMGGLSKDRITDEGLLIRNTIEERVRERITARLHEELPQTEPHAVKGKAAQIARETAKEFLDEIVKPTAQRGAESFDEADGLGEGLANVADRQEDDNLRTLHPRLIRDILAGRAQDNQLNPITVKDFGEGLADSTGLAEAAAPPGTFMSSLIPSQLWERNTDYWKLLRGYVSGVDDTPRPLQAQKLHRARFLHAQRIMHLEDVEDSQKHEAVLEMYKHQGLQPGDILKGSFNVSMSSHRLTQIWLQERGTPVTHPINPREITASKEEFEIPFKPADINPYEVPIWQSVHALELDLRNDRAFVEKVLLSTGNISKAELQDVIEAQKAAIQINYGL